MRPKNKKLPAPDSKISQKSLLLEPSQLPLGTSRPVFRQKRLSSLKPVKDGVVMSFLKNLTQNGASTNSSFLPGFDGIKEKDDFSSGLLVS